MHANPTQPAVKLKIGDETFDLVFDFEAIAEAEEITGKSLLSGLDAQNAARPAINFVRALFFACAKPRRPGLTYEQAKVYVTRESFADVWKAVLEAWTAAFTETEAQAEPADPSESQA